MTPTVPYLRAIRFEDADPARPAEFPFTLPFLRDLDLTFNKPVTFFVGENGSGKSTLLEAIAAMCRLPISGGGWNEVGDHHGPEQDSPLSHALRPTFNRKPKSGYFLRAEFLAHFASLLEQRRQDPDFLGNPYARYGGRSLHTRSHGEAFLAVLESWIGPGIFLFDEPEAALSPQRQLALLTLMARFAATGQAQFIVATHSPILMTFPDAELVSFDGERLQPVQLEETSHFQVTSGILQSPQRYWRHLVESSPAAVEAADSPTPARARSKPKSPK